MLGLPNGKVVLVPWTEQWGQHFTMEKEQLEQQLGPLLAAAHHIGSTAVPNLSAKPIIDIALEIRHRDDAAECIARLEQMGYIDKGDTMLPERHYLTKGSPRTHQIHMFVKGNHYVHKHLAFRDHLRRSEEDRNRYEQLKTTLANAHPDNRIAYADAKTDFVQDILRKLGN